jgi:hypothetical protein
MLGSCEHGNDRVFSINVGYVPFFQARLCTLEGAGGEERSIHI